MKSIFSILMLCALAFTSCDNSAGQKPPTPEHTSVQADVTAVERALQSERAYELKTAASEAQASVDELQNEIAEVKARVKEMRQSKTLLPCDSNAQANAPNKTGCL